MACVAGTLLAHTLVHCFALGHRQFHLTIAVRHDIIWRPDFENEVFVKLIGGYTYNMSKEDSGPSAYFIFIILMAVIFISGMQTNKEMGEVEATLDAIKTRLMDIETELDKRHE